MRTIVGCFAALSLGMSNLFSQTFVDVSATAGLGIVRQTNGVAVADYDGDGDLDAYFVAHQQYDENDETTWNRLMRNEGDGVFSDATLQAGLVSKVAGLPASEMGYKFGAAWGDYDNDGFPDIFLTNFGHNLLYHNNGNGTFSQVTEEAGLRGSATSVHSSAVWWDYDLDGDLDLYVSAWQGQNRMYENGGAGAFTDVTERSGLANPKSTWTSIPIDANGDGRIDLYTVDDFKARNQFFLNLGGGLFREATAEFGLESAGNGMGVSAGDYNNDGLFDIYVTNISGLEIYDNETNPLFTNTGSGGFTDVAQQAGVAEAGWGWGNEFFDCDHDGDVDLYVVNGFDFSGSKADSTNLFFVNHLREDGGGFIDVTTSSGAGGRADGLGLVVFDCDSDGDLDLLVSNSKKAPYLYENQTASQNWLQIGLEGTISNRSAFGATVEVVAGDNHYYRQNDGVDFLGQSVQPLHFGIADAQQVGSVIVRWPNGLVEDFGPTNSNQMVLLREGEGQPTSVPKASDTYMPAGFQLLGNFPNPFNGGTKISFELDRPGHVTITVVDMRGRIVSILHDDFTVAGNHTLFWDARNQQGRAVASGVYVYKASFQNRAVAGKMLYLK